MKKPSLVDKNVKMVGHIIDLVGESSISAINLNRVLGYVGANLGGSWGGIFEYTEYPFRSKLITSWCQDTKHVWQFKDRAPVCIDDARVTRLIKDEKILFIGSRIAIPETIVKKAEIGRFSRVVILPINYNKTNQSAWGFIIFYCVDLCFDYSPDKLEILRILEYVISNAYIRNQVEHELRSNLEGMKNTEKAILNVLEDVEDEKKKSVQLAKDLEKFKQAVDDASDHIVITDPDGIILYANRGVERITGYSPEEIIGKNPGKLWGGQMKKDYYVEFWKVIKTEKREYSGELVNKKKNGEQYSAEVHVSPVLDGFGEILFFVGIERDITKAKVVDRMKTEFISLASHQLRTPLSAIRWYVEMLESEDAGKMNDAQKEFVDNISKSTVRMIALVNGLLNISRIESGRIIIDPQLTDIVELIQGVKDEIEVKLKEKNIVLVINAHKTLPKIKLDQKLIRNVFMNLLTNSIKYSEKNKTITIFVSKRTSELLIQVADEGYGIPDDEQDKVFNKFFRATNAVKIETDGNGLGLYLVKVIIDSSGGKIWFKSKVGQGSTFWFTLPIKGVTPKKGEVTIDS